MTRSARTRTPRLALTIARSDRDAVFLHGRIGDVEGLFRSDGSDATWIRIDDPARRSGWLRAVAGDGHAHGRVYLGTSGRGIIVGEPKRN